MKTFFSNLSKLIVMKGFSYYVCPHCGNVLASSSPLSPSCCGNEIAALMLSEAFSSLSLPVRKDGDEIIVSLTHPMRKDEYVTFIAIESYDTLVLKKLYAEWNEDVIFPYMKGRLVWATSSGKGYFQKLI